VASAFDLITIYYDGVKKEYNCVAAFIN